VGNLPVLTKSTAQGAAGDEDGSRTSEAGKGWFFAPVYICHSKSEFRCFAAETPLAPIPVYSAVPRAERAGGVKTKE